MAKGLTKGQKIAIGVGTVIIIAGIGYALYRRSKKRKDCKAKGGTWNKDIKECEMPVEPPKEEKNVIEEAYNSLLFETGKSTIRSASFPSLDKLADVFKSQPTWNLNLVGHTDSSGDNDFNLKLSKERALAVKTYLTGKGIEASRMTAKGMGETFPIADNNTPEGRALNRRVEFRVVKA